MNSFSKGIAILGLLGLTASAANAQVPVTSDITTSTTWTSNNVYDLRDQIYVRNGATLTIEAGTVIASETGVGGSLAVTRGSRIIAEGTRTAPIVFTSSSDRATWTGGDPATGAWREGCNEWGNLTLMGNAYISEDATLGNVPTCDAGNRATMEGLVEAMPGDPDVLYGGGDDDDNSGTLAYCSFRYGGKVIGLNNELNGLSLGGIGRGTDIHHVEVMNNVDDGIEIWGGTVNLKYFSIWNVGDDSFDVDQGWRGKAQFGLVVQGYSCDDSQGSGVGDNCFEMDGAENSSWQPVTTASIYNVTVVGNNQSGDGLTAWRDGARVQFRNSIFMDGGEKVVRFDDLDGDGGLGYGSGGTLSWAGVWTTAYDSAPAHANDCPAGTYTAQVDGRLSEIKDSVFYNNTNGSAYTEAEDIGGSGFNIFTVPGNNNVKEPASSPIKGITRGAQVIKGGLPIEPVTFLDPRPDNDAQTAAGMAPDDGFFCPIPFRGAFDPGCPNWLQNWTASFAYGFTPKKFKCFDMLVGSNAVAQLSIIKAELKATVVFNGAVVADDAPITVIQASPIIAEFNAGPVLINLTQNGAVLEWTSSNGFSGTLSPVQ